MKRKFNSWILAAVAGILFASTGCKEVDNSELCTWDILFISRRADTVMIHLVEQGTGFFLAPGDTVNEPYAGPGKIPTFKKEYRVEKGDSILAYGRVDLINIIK
jgi:hypothetical protein